MELTEYTVEEESEVPSSKDVAGLEEGNNKFPETKVALAAGLDFKVISTD